MCQRKHTPKGAHAHSGTVTRGGTGDVETAETAPGGTGVRALLSGASSTIVGAMSSPKPGVIEIRRNQMFPTLATGEIERRIVAPSGFAFRELPL